MNLNALRFITQRVIPEVGLDVSLLGCCTFGLNGVSHLEREVDCSSTNTTAKVSSSSSGVARGAGGYSGHSWSELRGGAYLPGCGNLRRTRCCCGLVWSRFTDGPGLGDSGCK